jgi:osmotically inducible lipoprotein OsmB
LRGSHKELSRNFLWPRSLFSWKGLKTYQENLMLTRATKIIAISVLAFGTAATAANADCGHKATGTAIGAVGGGVVGSVITHGSPLGIIGGAVGGGLIGHSVSHCRSHYYHHRYRHGYYDRYHHWHHYASR